ncbi:DUF2993 domain-containing protein [Blastococcus sp. TF02A-35]|uniref:LmeA family phospholipid-binding protein n=1 Tax=Blastococcus sp. TF02A-35 TaxID=2559612 RepID=UPI00107437A6|nr:DUF2993 domain-containing protein [Blastococcus sp. TF02A_35]TFV53362.1 DUF2993 domain-containing protein [Blastococcus sp. TF02A_35]
MRALVVLLVLLVGLGVLLDRVAVGVAEGQVARQIAAQGDLPGRPEVEIRGFPFLSQAFGGRYRDVRISLTAEQLGRPEGTTADVVLRGVRLPLSSVVSGEVREVPVDSIDGTATLSYELLAQELGGDTTLRREGDGLRITRTVEVFGVTLPLTAVGTVGLDGDVLVVDVERASGAGVDVPGFLVERASDLLDLRYPVELPFGLRLTGVSPADDGVEVRVEARDTVLAAE